VSASQYQVRLLKYVDMRDNCGASALSYDFGERGCTAGWRFAAGGDIDVVVHRLSGI
jgi:hypothetical protein